MNSFTVEFQGPHSIPPPPCKIVKNGIHFVYSVGKVDNDLLVNNTMKNMSNS